MSVEPPKVDMDDVMLAMDVVDTLRHSSRVVERELDAEGQDQRLLERLRNIYSMQGIDVPDHILREGVDALREDRFRYTPTPPSFSRWLAELYVGKGAKKQEIEDSGDPQKKTSGLKKFLLIGLCVYLGFFIIANFQVLLPNSEINTKIREKQRYVEYAQSMPQELDNIYRRIKILTENPEIREQARQISSAAQAALWAKDIDAAIADKEKLESISHKLTQEYDLRIVGGSNEQSGVWRVPDGNQNARNYYVIVEPVNEQGRVISLDILNEENNKMASNVKKFGVRVPEPVFEDVKRDKSDDGIIQNNIIGSKKRGELEVIFNREVMSGRITDW